MKIEYWSDFVCPYCYIGKNRLKKVLEELQAQDQVEVVMRSFELDRNAPLKVKYNAEELFALKYGLNLSTAHAKVNQISETGRKEGLTEMDYAGTRVTNTLDAHRLSKYASKQRCPKMEDALYHAFFCKHRNIGEREVLLKLAGECGLDVSEAEKVLVSGAYEDEVRKDERDAKIKGLHLIPHFIFDGKEKISGSGSMEEIRDIILKYL